MTRDFQTNPLTIPSTYAALRDSILRVLTNRHPLESAMPSEMLRAAVRETSEVDFLSALSGLTTDGLVQCDWGRGCDNKRTGFYSAVRKPQRSSETLLGDRDAD